MGNGIAGFTGNNQGKAETGFAQVAHGGELVANGAAIDVEQITFIAARKLNVRRQVVHPRVGSEIGRMGNGGGGFQVARSSANLPRPFGQPAGNQVGLVQGMTAAAQGDIDTAFAQFGDGFAKVQLEAEGGMLASDAPQGVLKGGSIH